MSDLPARVRAYCRKHDLLAAGRVLVAVSGGADSLTLLHLLIGLQTEFSISLHVATLDHGIRGAESSADAEYVRATAEAWSVPITVGRADVPALARSEGIGIEAAARQARYRFLLETAQHIGAFTIAIGHNRDDQAETVLMHVLRGTGLSGLRGMLPKTPLFTSEANLIRPLLAIPRADIDRYAAEYNLQPRTDSTNTDIAYFRNRLRLDVLPYLESINPALREALAHTAEITRADHEALQVMLHEKLDRSLVEFPRALFLSLPLALQRMAVRDKVLANYDLSFDQIETVIDFIRQGHGRRVDLIPGMSISVFFEQVSFLPADAPLSLNAPFLEDDRALSVPLPGQLELANGWRLETRPLTAHDDPDQWRSDPCCAVLYVPSDARIELRRRRPGDRFQPKGLDGHTQKLSDTLINLKVPSAWRERVPLLIIDDQIAWFVVPTAEGLCSRVAETFMLELQKSYKNPRGWVFRYAQTARI